MVDGETCATKLRGQSLRATPQANYAVFLHSTPWRVAANWTTLSQGPTIQAACTIWLSLGEQQRILPALSQKSDGTIIGQMVPKSFRTDNFALKPQFDVNGQNERLMIFSKNGLCELTSKSEIIHDAGNVNALPPPNIHARLSYLSSSCLDWCSPTCPITKNTSRDEFFPHCS